MGQLLQQIINDKKAIIATAEKHQATNLRLFGSVARGEDNESSDIDLLVDFMPGSTLFDQIDLMDELTQILGRKVDVVSSRALNEYIRQRILEEALPL
ncbi:MAG: nucleotidyltransferase family protein [Deltaproteobacteria bacterium]|nr:nucleotidyltransferase family protein [Deltaproteobacteria bacterium]